MRLTAGIGLKRRQACSNAVISGNLHVTHAEGTMLPLSAMAGVGSGKLHAQHALPRA